MKNKTSRNKQLRPTIKVKTLAKYVAEMLNDTEMLPFYIACCNRYPESCIRKALIKTTSIDRQKRKNRRGKFFKQVIYEYAKENYNNYRNKSRS